MEINQETKEAIANSVIAAAYHFSRGDDESVNYCKELLVEAVAALEEHLGLRSDLSNAKEPQPLDVPPSVG